MDLPKVSEVEAIDFQKLYREEKRKAREQRRKARSRQQQADDIEEHKGGDETIPQAEKTKTKVAGETNPSYFPPWEYHTALTALPMLDRKKDRISRKKKNHPGTIYYKSRYIQDIDYQQELMNWLQQLPENKQLDNEDAANGKWTCLPHSQRRVALFDGRKQRFPPPLCDLVDALIQSNVFLDRPNHILINEYTASQGILPHTDGPAYLDITATISLGNGSVLLHFTPIDNGEAGKKKKCSVLLEGHGSLVVFEGDAYSHYMHSIDELPVNGREMEHAEDDVLNTEPGTAVLRDRRISITVRHKKE